jgi:hypothetical protein
MHAFEDFEFRAAFTDRKNTPTFAAVMVKKIKLPFSCLKLSFLLFWQNESGRGSGQSLCPLYRPSNLCLLLRLYYSDRLHTTNGKIRREIQDPQMFETDRVLFPSNLL